MADLRLSEDGLYYWDGSRWISTLSPDGRWRWNGSAWVPVAATAAPVFAPYPSYQQATPRRPTPWTKPMQYAVAAWYAVSGLYALSLPFWMSGTMSQMINQSIQRSTAQNPEVSPPPAEVVSSITTMMSGVLWIAAIFGVVFAVVVIIGALARWTWMFYVVLVLLGFSTAGLPLNLIGAVAGSTPMNPFSLPVWISWLSVALGVPSTALFVWMLVAVVRYGPWAMTRKVESPQIPQPATG
jgi:hypothetical protein